MSIIQRHLQKSIIADLKHEPGVVLLGPRQVGKTTLAKRIAQDMKAVYLDLQSASDRLKIDHPATFFNSHKGKLVILDEVQTYPDLFTELRGIVDRNREAGFRSGQFLLLGSASDQLLRQSSESLTGRIMTHELTGFNLLELPSSLSMDDLWLKGGYPESILASSNRLSWRRRDAIYNSVINSDIPQIAGARYDTARMGLFLGLVATVHGQLFNGAKIASSLDVSIPTVKNYLNVFENMLLLRVLKPWYRNERKRLIQSPKVYFRDSGMLHTLLRLQSHDDLHITPFKGASWEGFVIEQIYQRLPQAARLYHYRTKHQTELDLIIEFSPVQRWAIEIKSAELPKLRPSFNTICDEIDAQKRLLIHRGQEDFSMPNNVEALTLPSLLEKISYD